MNVGIWISRSGTRPALVAGLSLGATVGMLAHGAGDVLAAAQGAAVGSSGATEASAASVGPDDAGTEEDALPALVAYPMPTLTGQGSQRQGVRYRIWVRWAPVPGAVKYQAQVSRTLDFERLHADTLLKKTAYTLSRQRPGLYFARVRALGPAGQGMFGRTLVIDAVGGGSAKAAAAAPARGGPERASRRVPASQPESTEGGEREPGVGASAAAGGGVAVEESSPPLDYANGPDPDDLRFLQLAPVRLRLGELRRELADLHKVRAEMGAIAARLHDQVRDEETARVLEQLGVEIQRSDSKRLELLRRIQQTEQELNRCLGDHGGQGR